MLIAKLCWVALGAILVQSSYGAGVAVAAAVLGIKHFWCFQKSEIFLEKIAKRHTTLGAPGVALVATKSRILCK